MANVKGGSKKLWESVRSSTDIILNVTKLLEKLRKILQHFQENAENIAVKLEKLWENLVKFLMKFWNIGKVRGKTEKKVDILLKKHLKKRLERKI